LKNASTSPEKRYIYIINKKANRRGICFKGGQKKSREEATSLVGMKKKGKSMLIIFQSSDIVYDLSP
jgi:hypothetical protein